MLRVFKFGGALLKDIDGIRKAASIIEEFSCEPLVVVVSALGKTTNALEHMLELAFSPDKTELALKFEELKQFHLLIAQSALDGHDQELVAKLEEFFTDLWELLHESYEDRFYAYDQVVGMGEQFSSLIIYHTLKNKGIAARFVDAQSIIVTNSKYTDASVDWKFTQKTTEARILPALENKQLVLTQGFIGADGKGQFTTLGREGSDFTAAILAYVLNADEVTIWKDVPGLMNADPNRFDDCVKLDHISYREAIELAFYGASVIHPKTIQPLQQKNIPLFVHSFYQPEIPPTLINSDTTDDHKIHSIIVKDRQVLLSIASQNLSFIAEENLTDIFNAFSQHNIHINLMQHSAVSFSVCFDYDAKKFPRLLHTLEGQFGIRYNSDLQLITIRHYNKPLVETLLHKKEVLLEQKSRSTYQVLVKAG